MAEFTYPADVTDATDPATVTDVEAGDWIHVESDPTLHTTPYAYDAQVVAVDSDEFGLYFRVEGVELGGVVYGFSASTIVDRIRRLEPPQSCAQQVWAGNRYGDTPEPPEYCENEAGPGSDYCDQHPADGPDPDDQRDYQRDRDLDYDGGE